MLRARSGLRPFGKSQAALRFAATCKQYRDLLEILEDRHGQSATLITSHFPVSQWQELINDATVADAILDRLVHNAYRLELKGESLHRSRAVPGPQL